MATKKAGQSAKKGASTRAKKLSRPALTKLRTRLEAEREELLAQAVVLDATAVVGHWRDGGYTDDSADTGTATFERERAQSLAINARRILVQVDDALKRIDSGDYGKCERCGEQIEVGRLEALPYATLCLSCKQLAERTA